MGQVLVVNVFEYLLGLWVCGYGARCSSLNPFERGFSFFVIMMRYDDPGDQVGLGDPTRERERDTKRLR